MVTPEAKLEKQREYCRRYRERNRERYNQLQREWRLRNPEKHYANVLRYIANNREKNREMQRAYRQKNLEKVRARDRARDRRKQQREYQLRTRYGMSVKAYDELVAAAKGLCAICGRKPKQPLYVDHCHEAGHVRGLLCVKCNMAIGHLDNSPQRALKVYEYLVREALFNQSKQ
jgi:hypothetical protein